MDPEQVEEVLVTLWIWIAAPLAGLAALVATVRFRLPQVTRIADAFRGLKAQDPNAQGSLPPASAVVLSGVASYGAAGAVGAATAVSLGGAGAIAWVWLFAFLLAPMRMAESALARTTPPGEAHGSTGSLAGRLLADPIAGMRWLGWALLVLVPLTGFAYFGGAHGEAVLETAEQVLPGSALTLGLGVAVAGGVLSLAPPKKIGGVLGWIGLVSLIAMLAAAVVAFISEPARGFSAFGRAATSALYDAPRAGAFSGALAGEIATAAVLYLLPPVAATSGMDGALHAEAQAETTRRFVPSALLGALIYGVMTTLVGLSLVATNAFSERVEDTRSLSEVRFYEVGGGFETTSQRLERDRLEEHGLVRAPEGRSLVDILVATERGMVQNPLFEEADGTAANLAIGVDNGRADYAQSPSDLGVLTNRPAGDLHELTVRGDMLPRGGRLLSASMARAGGEITSRVALAALLLLAILGAVAWGLGLRRTLEARVPSAIARWSAVLPSVGLALAALSVIPSFGAIGLVCAALLTTVTAIAIIVRSRDAALQVAPTSAPAAKAQPARPAPPADAPPKKTKRKKKRKKP